MLVQVVKTPSVTKKPQETCRFCRMVDCYRDLPDNAPEFVKQAFVDRPWLYNCGLGRVDDKYKRGFNYLEVREIIYEMTMNELIERLQKVTASMDKLRRADEKTIEEIHKEMVDAVGYLQTLGVF